MIQYIKNIFEAKQLESENRVNEQRAIRKLLESTNVVTESPESDGYTRTGSTDSQKGHLEPKQLDMVRKAREFFKWDSNGRAAIQTMVNYIMGQGVNITPMSEDPMVWYVWREFWSSERNKMELRQFEIPLRMFRDGEVFIELFSSDANGRSTGKTTVRFVDPLLVKNPAASSGTAFDINNTRAGIETDPNDAERVIRYWVQDRIDQAKFRAVKPENMLHIKIFADSDQPRGESFIQPVMRMFTDYLQWLDNRIILNKMRSAIFLIKKIQGTPNQVQAIADAWKESTNTRTGSTKKQNIRGGTMLLAGPGIDYKMESPNINAADVKDDGRNIKLAIAAGTNLPEYVFGDASNANYASTMVAEAPFVKAIQYWQEFLEYWFGLLFRRVLENAAKAKLITPPNDEEYVRKLKGLATLEEQAPENEPPMNGKEPEETPRMKMEKELMPDGKVQTPSELFFGIDAQWPEIVHRDMKAHTESLQIARMSGWVSDPTCAAQLGFNYGEEVRKQKMVEDEAEMAGNPFIGSEAPGKDDAGDMDAEIQNVLKTLTPEEQQMVLQKNDPREIAAMLLTKVGTNGNGGTPPPPPQEGE